MGASAKKIKGMDCLKICLSKGKKANGFKLIVLLLSYSLSGLKTKKNDHL